MEPTERPDQEDCDKIRVLITEDQQIYRTGLHMVLEPFADQLTIIGEAADAADAVAQVTRSVPHVVLMDLKLPPHRGLSQGDARHGVAAIAQMRRAAPNTRILVMSAIYEKPLVVFEALRAGADGYIAKDDDAFDGRGLAQAIRAVARGEAVFGPVIAKLLSEYRSIRDLTEREREILDLLGQGMSNSAIGQELYISESTVKTHVSNILTKLHISAREEIPYLGFTTAD